MKTDLKLAIVCLEVDLVSHNALVEGLGKYRNFQV